MLRFISFIIFVLTLGLLSKVLFLESYPDFSVDYFGVFDNANRINPYTHHPNYFAPFVIPPFSLIFFRPFILFPLVVAGKLWTILSIFMLLASLFLILRTYKQKVFSPTPLLLSSLAFLYFPTKFTLGMGEINMIILVCLSLFLYFSQRKESTLAGVILGIGYMIKLFPILLVPFFIVKGQWRILSGIAATGIVLAIVTMLTVEPSILGYFLTHTLPGLTGGWKTDYYNQALSGLLARHINDISLRYMLRILISGIAVVITGFLLLKSRSKKMDVHNLQIGTVITLNLLINTFSWQHHYIWLVIPLLTTYFFLRSVHLGWKYYVVLGICYVLTGTNLAHPDSVPTILQSHVFYGALLLYLLDLYLLMKYGVYAATRRDGVKTAT